MVRGEASYPHAMTRSRWFPLLLLVTAEVAAVVVLHRLGTVDGLDIGTLVATGAATEDVLMAGARLAALGIAWWLLVSTTLCTAAHAVRLPRAVRAVEWAVLPGVRRFVERSLAATLTLSAAALPVAPVLSPAPAVAQQPVVATLVPVVHGGVVVPPAAAIGRGPVQQVADAAVDGALPREHLVAEGEHLWGLAAAVVAEGTGRSPGDVEPSDVAAYWVRIIEANPQGPASGDPDVIYPGERLRLPPLRG